MADASRGAINTIDYKCAALGFISLKYISNAFEKQRRTPMHEPVQGADLDECIHCRAVNIVWVLPKTRWLYLKGQVRQPIIAQIVDNILADIAHDNPTLKGVLPKDYAPPLDKTRLGHLIDLISNIRIGEAEELIPNLVEI